MLTRGSLTGHPSLHPTYLFWAFLANLGNPFTHDVHRHQTLCYAGHRMSSAYVQVAVPEGLVEDVYRLIGSWASKRSPKRAQGNEDIVWNDQQLRHLRQQANPRLEQVLRFVASRPEGITSEDLLKANFGFQRGRGIGGFFGRQAVWCQARFGRSLPLNKEWDREIGHNRYWMRPDWARVILE